MTSQILGSWFSPELRSWFHLGLRRFADADTLHEWTLTSNPLSQSPLAIRHSQELFAQIGKVQKSGLNFDQNGRSKGTAEVVFANKRDAVQAIKTYNGVKLDGRPLQIELIGGAPGGMTLSSGVTITPAGGRRSVTFNGGGGGGRKVVAKVVARPGAKKGGAKAKAGGAKGAGAKGKPKPKPKPRAKKETPLTAEQLDAQMDAYKGAAAAADAAPADAPAAMEA